jgi:pyroglutamyl-peptidase
MQKILLTSFQTWQSHQSSNSSDDLLELFIQRNVLSEHVHFLRHLPVDFELAPEAAIAFIETLKPDLIICCGMAENRQRLSVESNGKCQEKILLTRLDLEQILDKTCGTDISYDAGNFVCNHLYYSVLKYIRESLYGSRCLFVHVPILTEENSDLILQDFLIILQNLSKDRVLTG